MILRRHRQCCSRNGAEPMNAYHIWFNLKDSHRDVEFARHIAEYLGYLKERGWIKGHRLTRRTLGFGPPELGEFHVEIQVESLAGLDEAFGAVAARSGDLEQLHARVYSAVTDFRSALYRDFPDPVRDAT